jgi:hypothetical protein
MNIGIRTIGERSIEKYKTDIYLYAYNFNKSVITDPPTHAIKWFFETSSSNYEINLMNNETNQTYKGSYKQILKDILKNPPNKLSSISLKDKRLEELYNNLFEKYRSNSCSERKDRVFISKEPLDKIVEDELIKYLTNLNEFPTTEKVIEFENIHQYYIFLLIILALDPLHDYTESRLKTNKNTNIEKIKNLRQNYKNIGDSLYKEYIDIINESGSNPEPLVESVYKIINKETNLEDQLLHTLIGFNYDKNKKIRGNNSTNKKVNEPIEKYQIIRNEVSKIPRGRFASVNSVSRSHTNDREPMINKYHTHFTEQSMDKTQFCLISTMIDGCKGCCDNFQKIYNGNISDTDRKGIAIELGNINVKFTYRGSNQSNYLNIKSKIIKLTPTELTQTKLTPTDYISTDYNYYSNFMISRSSSRLTKPDTYSFYRQIYPNVDEITVSKMFEKYDKNEPSFYPFKVTDTGNIDSTNACKYTEKMVCDFLQGLAVYFKNGGCPNGVTYFPENNNVLKHARDGNCIRVTEHTDRPAAILCHHILQGGFKDINENAHAAYLSSEFKNCFLSNIDGIVVETITPESVSEKVGNKRKHRGGGYVDVDNYETYINESYTRDISDMSDVYVLYEDSMNKQNNIEIFEYELPNSDTIKWASLFNYNEEQIHQINLIGFFIIMKKDTKNNFLFDDLLPFIANLIQSNDNSIDLIVNDSVVTYDRCRHFLSSVQYFLNNENGQKFKELFSTELGIRKIIENIITVTPIGSPSSDKNIYSVESLELTPSTTPPNNNNASGIPKPLDSSVNTTTETKQSSFIPSMNNSRLVETSSDEGEGSERDDDKQGGGFKKTRKQKIKIVKRKTRKQRKNRKQRKTRKQKRKIKKRTIKK